MAPKCGKGWTIECLDGRRHFEENKIPMFEVVAKERYSDQTKHVINSATNQDMSNKLVDVVQIKTPCNKDSIVTLNGQGARFEPKNNFHYLICYYDKFDFIHTEDANKVYPFVKTVKQAFQYIWYGKDMRHEHELRIDGTRMPLNVYPGDEFKLAIDLPGLYSKKIERGSLVKKSPDIKGQPDAAHRPGSSGEKAKPPRAMYEIQVRRETSLRYMRTEVMTKFESEGFTIITKESVTYWEFTMTETVTVRQLPVKQLPAGQLPVHSPKKNSFLNALKKPAISLYRNNEKVTLSEIESLLLILSLTQKIMELIRAIQDCTPKVGWYCELKLDLLKLQLQLIWGFLERKDHLVEPYRALGAKGTLIDADVELGFGLKSSLLTAVVFVSFKGKMDFSGTILSHTDPTAVEYVPKAGAEITPSIGAKIKAGKGELFSGSAILACKFSVEISFNDKYLGNDNEHLCNYSLTIGTIEFAVLIYVNKSVIFEHRSQVPGKKHSGTIPTKEKPEDYKETPSDYEKSLREEIRKIRIGEKRFSDGLIVAKNEHWDDFHLSSSELISVDKITTDVIGKIQEHVGGKNNYESFFDFSKKSAEGLAQALADLVEQNYVYPRSFNVISYDGCISHTDFKMLLNQDAFKKIVQNYIDPYKTMKFSME